MKKNHIDYLHLLWITILGCTLGYLVFDLLTNYSSGKMVLIIIFVSGLISIIHRTFYRI